MREFQDYIDGIAEYTVCNVGNLLKEPRAFIKYPFIDPGSVYDGNIWDWDTYWSVYALFSVFDRFTETVQQKIVRHSKGNVLNFLDHQLADGYIPMMIEVSDLREPYLNQKHKEGVLMNMHKPFLCQQILLISDFIADFGWMDEFVPNLEKYFQFYRKTYYNEEKGLYVWCDDIMIGMDNDPASFGRPKFSTANIFLNSFMVMELKAFAGILRRIGAEGPAFYEQEATHLAAVIQEECWDRRDRFFYSVDVNIKTRKFDWFHEGLGVFWKTLPIKIRTWSGFLPLLAGFASKEQAEALVRHYRDENTFYSRFGITTLARDEKMYNLEATNNPSNWLGPIWLVANYVVFKGLLDYGYLEEAREICENSLTLLGEDLRNTGALHEFYHPDTGTAIMNGGFLNWNMLVLTMAKELEAAG